MKYNNISNLHQVGTKCLSEDMLITGSIEKGEGLCNNLTKIEVSA